MLFKHVCAAIWFAFACAAPLIACADDLENALKDLTAEQRAFTRIARLPANVTARMTVSAWVDRADATYAPGDGVTVFVKADRDAFITVLDIGTSGRVNVMFPNVAQPDSRVDAHRVLRIGSSSTDARLRVHGPAGLDVITVIASAHPLDLVALAESDAVGPFRVLHASSSAVAARILASLSRAHDSVASATVLLRISTQSARTPQRR